MVKRLFSAFLDRKQRYVEKMDLVTSNAVVQKQ